jgi:hypothetical protein
MKYALPRKQLLFAFCSVFLIAENSFSQNYSEENNKKLNERRLLHDQSLAKSAHDSLKVAIESPEIQVIPTPCPKLNTEFEIGEKVHSEEEYSTRKDQWILEHPEEYKTLLIVNEEEQKKLKKENNKIEKP